MLDKTTFVNANHKYARGMKRKRLFRRVPKETLDSFYHMESKSQVSFHLCGTSQGKCQPSKTFQGKFPQIWYFSFSHSPT